ncbi:hypothetical protein VNO77_31003 [Canavalia gladiata]|uniref:Uncharacterized protein n=1 Tax=Canavalia gladiata TaxID=3824 RepID=A0AAN9KNM6_CANGL
MQPVMAARFALLFPSLCPSFCERSGLFRSDLSFCSLIALCKDLNSVWLLICCLVERGRSSATFAFRRGSSTLGYFGLTDSDYFGSVFDVSVLLLYSVL